MAERRERLHRSKWKGGVETHEINLQDAQPTHVFAGMAGAATFQSLH